MTIQSIPRVLSALFTMGLGMAMHQPVFAAAYGEISLQNYSYTLTDLDPSDAHAPSVTWGEGTLEQYVKGAESSVIKGDWAPTVSFEGPVVTQSFNGPIDASHSSSLLGFEASSGPNGLTLSADVPAAGAWAMEQLYTVGFVLSPGTAITITAKALVSTGVDVPGSGSSGTGAIEMGQQAAFQNVLTSGLFLTNDPRSVIMSPYDCLSCTDSDPSGVWLRTFTTESRQVDRDLEVTWSNQGATSMPQYLSVLVQQSGYATAVPELSTWAQLALGMAGLAALMHKRRHHRIST